MYKEESDLIFTPTNSIEESKGDIMGLEGNQAGYLFAGLLVSLCLTFIGLFEAWPIMVIIIAFAIPLIIAFMYLWIFKINKPPGYQEDIISLLMNGPHDDIYFTSKENPYLILEEEK